MGGEGPYVEFDAECTERELAGLAVMDDQHLNEAYTRAHGFLLDNARKLEDFGWKQQETDDSLLVSLETRRRNSMVYGAGAFQHKFQRQIQLPRNVSAFFEYSFDQKWEKMFEKFPLFDVRRWRGSADSDSGSNRYRAFLYPEVEDPLRDIFYLLQCLIPGMLSIIRIDEIDDIGEDKITQILPPATWVEDYSQDIRRILGDEGFDEVKQAPPFLSRMLSKSSFWQPDEEDEDEDEEEMLDFTACDKECGYCGRCEY